MTLAEEVNSLLDIVNEKITIYTEIKAELNKNHALDFNPVDIFFPLGENKLSQILAFFLNPKERHFQGDIYLKAFLKYLDLTPELEKIKNFKSIQEIKTEQKIDNNRRIDIYLTYLQEDFESKEVSTHCIAIENKIWAEDQADQLKDYAIFLNKEHNENYLLIYLNPHGNTPSDYSIPKEERLANPRIKILNHSEGTIQLIEQWMIITKPVSVRIFLEQIKNYLEKEINNLKFMDMEQSVIASISQEKLEAAFAIANSLPLLKEEVAKDFSENLIKKFKELDIDKSDVINQLNGVKISIDIKLKTPFEGYIIGLNTDPDGLWYSIIDPESDTNKKVDFYRRISEKIKGNVNECRYWKHLEFPHWYNDAEGVKYMKAPRTIDIVASQLIDFKNLIEGEIPVSIN